MSNLLIDNLVVSAVVDALPHNRKGRHLMLSAHVHATLTISARPTKGITYRRAVLACNMLPDLMLE